MTSPPPTGDESPERAMLDVALDAAREAAELHRERAGSLESERWSEKGTSDFVTEVDRESERLIIGRIRSAFPGDRVLAEEGTETGGEGTDADGRLWVIDPLDGTTNWLHGYPEYSVSIAALDGHGLGIGVVVNSATGETFTAIRGHGARRDGRAIRVSAVSELRLGLIGTGFPFKRSELIPDYLRVLGRMLRSTSGVRRGGSAALDLCDLACGRLDGFWEHWLMPWDVAAGALIVREAGGTFGAFPARGAGEPVFAAAADRGETTARAFASGRAELPADGAAFTAANGRIDDALKGLLEEALGG